MSVGGGGGKGTSSGSQSDPAAAALAQLAQQFATETTGLRTGLIGNLTNVINDPSGKITGGIQVPLISQAVTATRRAASDAQRQTGESLAQTGQSGTPFGQRILAEGKREGNLAASNARIDIEKMLYNLIPNLVLGQSQTALSGLSGAVGGNVSGKGKSTNVGAGSSFGGKK